MATHLIKQLEWIFSATKILLPNENLKQLWTFTPTQRHKTYSMNFLVKSELKTLETLNWVPKPCP